ncbi:MAG: XrtB/PEP-CTERM-associated polysaccharide biosynthesis outer membrane protein EpsL [Pseudomonadota bacterium]|nr:XrtB/PEP-CTERM-associated polysaccharide biosynthesis outer membrane protein EpsL [Pseudomonadota bacterium]
MEIKSRFNSLALLALLSASMPLYAEGEVIPFISLTTVSDNNLYRLDNSIDEDLLSVSKSDTIFQTAVGLNVDWKVSRQSFLFKASMVDSRFDKNSQLDNLGQNLSAKWNWLFGSQFKGVASVDHNVTLSDFANTTSLQKSERTQDRVNLTGNWRYHPSWQVGLGLNTYDSFYDTVEREVSDLEQVVTSLNWDYLSKTGSRLGLKLQSTNGELPNRVVTEDSFIDNEFDQNALLISALWISSGKSRFDIDFGLVTRKHPNISERDYDGVNANLKYEWFPTGKLLFVAEGYRKVVSSEDLLASYSENTGVKITSAWLFSDKVRLNANLGSEKRGYSGQTGFIDGLESTLEEQYDNYSLGLQYQPHRNFDLGLSYNRSYRDSTRELRDYSDDLISLNLTINL